MANDKNAARENESDKKHEELEARAKKEIALRVERGDFEETDEPISISIEGHYVNVHRGSVSFQYDANKEVGGDIAPPEEEDNETELEKASKSAKASTKKGK
jgi:hypothetical protein